MPFRLTPPTQLTLLISVVLAVLAVILQLPQAMSGCDLSTSRVSKVENLSPSASASTHAPSINFLGLESTLNASQRADILSSIFSPLMLSVVPVASSRVTEPTPSILMVCKGRKTCVRMAIAMRKRMSELAVGTNVTLTDLDRASRAVRKPWRSKNAC